MFHIGLDLDNTLINYSAVFGSTGVELGLLPEVLAKASKVEIRRLLLGRPGGEQEFMRLQGQVYGRYIERATLHDGVMDFIRALRDRDVRFSIVSHRTQYGHFDEARIDLRTAAMTWLMTHGLVGPGAAVPLDRVFFEDGRREKLARIAAGRCDIFIDDLSEVLCDPEFPRATEPLWFAPDGQRSDGAELKPYCSWPELTQAVLSRIDAKQKHREVIL